MTDLEYKFQHMLFKAKDRVAYKLEGFSIEIGELKERIKILEKQILELSDKTHINIDCSNTPKLTGSEIKKYTRKK